VEAAGSFLDYATSPIQLKPTIKSTNLLKNNDKKCTNPKREKSTKLSVALKLIKLSLVDSVSF